MNVLDLFSGIGGFSLGLERAGMHTVAFCEIDPHARKVLAKHWPNTPIFEDVSTLTKDKINEQIDVLAGGFPCQDISTAGRGAGLSGSRSGLWFQFHRLINEIRPRYAIIENVSALRSRGLDEVLRSLAEIGYDAEWHCIPASAVGAPHRRDRIWIVAYPNRSLREGTRLSGGVQSCDARLGISYSETASMAYTASQRQPRQGQFVERRSETPKGKGQADTPLPIRVGGIWPVEPDVGRVANGIPNRSHRLKQLGNAVVPQIPELIGRAIMEYERDRSLA
jgi:DNA (cytosine-5)-methyltransferase 1